MGLPIMNHYSVLELQIYIVFLFFLKLFFVCPQLMEMFHVIWCHWVRITNIKGTAE